MTRVRREEDPLTGFGMNEESTSVGEEAAVQKSGGVKGVDGC